VLLAEHRDRVLSKDELFESLWEGRVVGDAALARLIKEARAALDDDAGQPRWIRTVPRVGYQWIAEADPARTDAGGQGARGWRWLGIVGGGLLALVIIVAGWLAVGMNPAPSTTTPSAEEQMPVEDVSELNARRLYEQGRQALRDRDRARLQDADALFQEALALNPDFASALAGRAIIPLLRVNPTMEEIRTARATLERALEIDPESSMAHAGIGLVFSFDPATREQAAFQLKRALELEPDNGEAMNWLATLLGSEGRLRESVLLRREALARDSTHTGLAGNLAIGLVALGRTAEARELIEPIARQPRDLRATRYPRQQIAYAEGRPDEALQITLEVLAEHPDSIDIQAEAFRLLVKLGLEAVLEPLFSRLAPCIPPRARAWAALEQAVAAGDPALLETALAPFLANLDRVPAFAADTVARGALLAGRADAAASLLLRRFPDGDAIHGEQGTVIGAMEQAMVAVEAARRLEDRERQVSLAVRIAELAALARANGYEHHRLDTAEAQAAFALGESNRAVQLVDEALDHGWWNWRQMATDPVWAPLRESGLIDDAIAEARQRQQAARQRVLDAPWFPSTEDWPVACDAPPGQDEATPG
jgi:tetratricopeptide (TPR) repeat protein